MESIADRYRNDWGLLGRCPKAYAASLCENLPTSTLGGRLEVFARLSCGPRSITGGYRDHSFTSRFHGNNAGAASAVVRPTRRRTPPTERNIAGSMKQKVEDQDGMEQAEHDLLADLRRARRSLRLQDMDEPPAVARLTPGQRIADAVATVMGSWSFIIVQSAILVVWIAANLVGAIRGWDPYPFILLNLALSFQAAYAAPVIMMSQNRQQDIDRKAAENDYRINVKAELEIELLHEKIDQLREREVLKLTEAVRMLTKLLEQSASGARETDAEAGRPS